MFNVYIYYLSVNVCMCNIKNTKKEKVRRIAHCYSCPEEDSSCNVWICSLSVSSTIGGRHIQHWYNFSLSYTWYRTRGDSDTDRRFIKR